MFIVIIIIRWTYKLLIRGLQNRAVLFQPRDCFYGVILVAYMYLLCPMFRPFFTYWVTVVQITCFIMSVAVFGIARIGGAMTTVSGEVWHHYLQQLGCCSELFCDWHASAFTADETGLLSQTSLLANDQDRRTAACSGWMQSSHLGTLKAPGSHGELINTTRWMQSRHLGTLKTPGSWRVN